MPTGKQAQNFRNRHRGSEATEDAVPKIADAEPVEPTLVERMSPLFTQSAASYARNENNRDTGLRMSKSEAIVVPTLYNRRSTYTTSSVAASTVIGAWTR